MNDRPALPARDWGHGTLGRTAGLALLASGLPAPAQDTLPFAPTPSASTAGLTIQDSVYRPRVPVRRLQAGAPNILIILMDDVGPGNPTTYGGEIHTPTLSRVARLGLSYNCFHSTAMSSPTRAALLTGRNHTHVCNGQNTSTAFSLLPATRYRAWTFSGPIQGMPEFTAPKLGKFDSDVSMEVQAPAGAHGVLYALGGLAGGLTCYVKAGVLCYEYNLFQLQRTSIKARGRLPAGKVQIGVESRLADRKPGSPMDVTLKVNGEVVAQGRVPVTAPFAFTANGCLDLGCDLGSPVSLEYFHQAPFAFNGTLLTTRISYP